MYKLAILFGCIVLTVPCAGGTVSVNWDGMGDYTTIQAGIDAANPGDTVIVTEGTYVENISFGGKNVILTSTDPDDWSVVAGTVIDGSGGAGPVVLFAGTEEATGELAGFTITGGYNTENGGGVQGSGSYASISRCVITGNTTENTGGGVQYFNGDISNCKIIGNSSGMNGGGLAGCQGRIENCVVSNNMATTVGGGMNNCDGEIVNCTIANNSGGNGGGLRICDGTITNCIIWGNSSPEIGTSSEPTYSCFVGGSGNGNIDGEPLFVNDANDFHLLAGSPCIDAGTYSSPYLLPATDIDGQPRVMGGGVDMGADEFSSTVRPFIVLSANTFEFTAYPGGANPDSQVLEIRNGGPSTLNWEITESCDWLEVNPASGSLTGEPNEVTLSVDITGLSLGDYNCELTVNAVGAVNSPQTVYVSLRVLIEGELHVPLQYSTIQAAINAAVNGDTVIVVDGVYKGSGNRNIDFKGKAITVRSVSGPENCIIDCQKIDRAFHFHNGEDENSVINGLTILNGRLAYGGGILMHSSSPTLINCVFRNNEGCVNGGGMYISTSNSILINCEFIDNIAEDGGGICMGSSNLTFTNCEFINNFADDDGGGICAIHDSNPTLTDCMFSNNLAGEGGGVYLEESGAIIENCEFTNNVAGDGGGIKAWDKSNPFIKNCIFRNNIASYGGGFGGGFGSSIPPVIIECDFIENIATSSGGGVYFLGNGRMILRNCNFTNNSARHGGGLGINSDLSRINNCLFVGNKASQRGGGLFAYESSSLISNNTFSGNTSIVEGGGMLLRHSSSRITNCILSMNVSPKGYEIYTDGDSRPIVSFCNINGGLTSPFVESKSGSSVEDGGDNIYDDPLFVNPGYWDGDIWINGDYHLQPGSPCIDKGSNNPPGGLATEDLDNDPRIINAIVDMGAYEAIPPSTEATMNLTPTTLNCSSEGNWVKAHFVLPEGYLLEDVDTDKPATIDSLTIISDHINVSYNNEGLVEIEVAFSRNDFCGTGLYDIELTVRGWFADETAFYGTDTIRITTNQLEKLPDFLSYWLNTDCSEPDWCDGFDVDHSSTVDLNDFALLE